MVRRANALSRYLAAIETPADVGANAGTATKLGAGCDAKKEIKGSSESRVNRENGAGDNAEENCNKTNATGEEGETNTAEEPLITSSETSIKTSKNDGSLLGMQANAARKWQLFPKTKQLSTSVTNDPGSVPDAKAQQAKAAPSTPTSSGYNSLITPKDIDAHSGGESHDQHTSTNKNGKHSETEDSKRYQIQRPNAVLSPEEFSVFASTPTSPGVASVVSTASVLNDNRGGNNIIGGGYKNQQIPPPPPNQHQHQQTTNDIGSNQFDRARRRWPPVSTALSVGSSSSSNIASPDLPATSGNGAVAELENPSATSGKGGKDCTARTKIAGGKNVSSASGKYKMVADTDTGKPLVKLVTSDSNKSGDQPGLVPSSAGKDDPAEVSHDSSERTEVSGSSIGHGVISTSRNLFGSHEKPSAIRSRVVTAGSAVSSSSTSGASGNITMLVGVTKWRRPPTHQINATPTRPSQGSAANTAGKRGNSGRDKKYRRINAGNAPSPPPRRFFPPSPSEDDHDLEGGNGDSTTSADQSGEWGRNTLDESFVDMETSGYDALDASGLWGGAETEPKECNNGGELSRDTNMEDSREEIECGTPERVVWKHALSSAVAPGKGEKPEGSNNTGTTIASGETPSRSIADTSRFSNTPKTTAAKLHGGQQQRQEKYQKRHHKTSDQPQARLEVDSSATINGGDGRRERGGGGNLLKKPSPFGRHMLRHSHRHRPSMGGEDVQDCSESATEAVESSQQTQAKGEDTEGNVNNCAAAEVLSGGYGPLDKKKGQQEKLQHSQNQYIPIKPSSLMMDRVGVSLQKQHLQASSSPSEASTKEWKDSKEKERPSQLQLQPLSQLKLVEASSSGAVMAARKQVFGLKHGLGTGALSSVESPGIHNRLQQISQQKQQGWQKPVDGGSAFEKDLSASKEDCVRSLPNNDCEATSSDSRTKSPKRFEQQVFADWAQNMAFPTPVLSCQNGGDGNKTGLYFPEWDSKASSADGTSTKRSTSDCDGGDPSNSPFSAHSPSTAFSPWRPSPRKDQEQQQLRKEYHQQNKAQPPSQPNLDGTAGNGSSNTPSPVESAKSNNCNGSNIAKKFLAALEDTSNWSSGKEDGSEGRKNFAAIVATVVSTSSPNKPTSSEGGASEIQCADNDGKVEEHKDSHQPCLDEEPRMGSETTSLASTLTTRLSMVEAAANQGQGKLQQPRQQKVEQQKEGDVSSPDGNKPNVPPTPRSAAAAAAAAANAVSGGFNHTRQGDERETVCGGTNVVLAFSSAYPSGQNLQSLEGLSPMPVPVLSRSTPSTSTPTLKAGAASGGGGSRVTEESPDPIMAGRSSPLCNEDEDSDDELSTTSSITTRPSMAPFLRCPGRGSGNRWGSTQVPKFPPAQVGASTPGGMSDVKVMPPTSAELWKRREAANAIRVAAAAAAMAGNTGSNGGLSTVRRGGGSGLPPPTPPTADTRSLRQRGGAGSRAGSGRKRTSTGGGGVVAKGCSPQAPVSGEESCGPNSVISERMMGYLREMELRMEDRMLRLETTMEERIQARMEYLEQKVDVRMDEIQKMLRLLVETGNNGGGWSSSIGEGASSGRESSSAAARLNHNFSAGTRPRRAQSAPDMDSSDGAGNTIGDKGEDYSVPARSSTKRSTLTGTTSKGQEDSAFRGQERIQTNSEGQLDLDSDDDVGADENTQCSI